MAHTYGALLTRASAATSPISVSLTVSAGVTAVALLLKTVGATNRAGGAPTWNGLTFTQANSTQKAAASPEASAELWYLINPPAATASLSIPNTGSATVFREVVGFSSATGSSAFLNANGGNNTAANPTPGGIFNPVEGSAFVALTAGGWQTWAPSAQVGTAINNVDDGADGYGSQYALNPATGLFTLSWTFGTSDDWGAVAAGFTEVPKVRLNNYLFAKSVSAGVISMTERIR
jgi:hypothetical protein